MIAALIRWSITNRFLVLIATLLVAAWGVWAVLRTPLDAIPDLSDVQVIIRTPFSGQAPRIVESQVTRSPRRWFRCRVRRPYAAIRCSATRSFMSCSKTAPFHTGRAPACSSS